MRQRTVMRIAELAEDCFTWGTHQQGRPIHVENVAGLADLLFEHEFDERVVKYARLQRREYGAVKRFIQILWAPDADWPLDGDPEVRMLRLSEALFDFSADKRNCTMYSIGPESRVRALSALQLEGFELRDGRLVSRDENVFDVQEQEHALVEHYFRLRLPRASQVRTVLKTLDEHYIEERYGDCIKHARDLLEVILHDVAMALATNRGVSLEGAIHLPRVLREKLEGLSFSTPAETKFLAALHGLVSDQGGHPNMSKRENARICRQYILSACHFALLRYEALTGVS